MVTSHMPTNSQVSLENRGCCSWIVGPARLALHFLLANACRQLSRKADQSIAQLMCSRERMSRSYIQ